MWSRLPACGRVSGGAPRGNAAGRSARPTILLGLLLCGISAGFGAGSEPATVTGRVFDVYHRPVPGARVVTIERQVVKGQARLVPGTSEATVDKAGMYRLALPAGRYILAVTPPPHPLDFAAVFPAYMGDNVEIDKAPSVEVRPGELRPFTDFLLLEVESHRVSGEVTGVPAAWGARSTAVSLYGSSGYTGPLQTALADIHGRFVFDHVPAGSYELKAAGPVQAIRGLEPQLGKSPRSGSVRVKVAAPEISGLRIQVRAAPR